MEGAELANQENNSVDRLMQYLDENLTTLSSQLNPDNFERILAITFDKLSRIMYDLVENGLEVRLHCLQYLLLIVKLNVDYLDE